MKYATIKKSSSFKHKKIILRNSSFEIPIYNFTTNKNDFYRTYYQNFNNKKNNPFCTICVNKDQIGSCIKGHNFHKIVKYSDYKDIIPPSKEEIGLLKMNIKLYKDKLTQLLY